jgi:hypothetical protein
MRTAMIEADHILFAPINKLCASLHVTTHFGKACFGQLRGLQLWILLNCAS